MSTTVVTMNEKDTLSRSTAKADLESVLIRYGPDLVFLQEWSTDRDQLTEAICDEHGYGWSRSPQGGGPVLWRKDRYVFRHASAVLLARAEFVGRLPGRRSQLGANYATEVILHDLTHDSEVAATCYHLDADAQDGGGGYSKDPTHLLRVLRHRRERRRLGKRSRLNQRKRRTIYTGGDSNFDGMTLGGFVNCWTGYGGGTLGWRAVDIVFAATKPAAKPRTYRTHSDHLAVCVRYQ